MHGIVDEGAVFQQAMRRVIDPERASIGICRGGSEVEIAIAKRDCFGCKVSARPAESDVPLRRRRPQSDATA